MSSRINDFCIDVLNNGKYGILYDMLIDAPIQPMPENIKEFVMKDYNNKKEKKKKASNRISNKIENKEVNVPSTLEYKYVLADLVTY